MTILPVLRHPYSMPGADLTSADVTHDLDGPKRILVILPGWVGDAVMATPALRALRTHYPEARITILCKAFLSTILSGGPWMDDVLHWPPRKRQPRPARRQSFLSFASTVREQGYDMAVLLANSFRAALLARLAGIRRRVGYDREGRGLLLTDKLLPARINGHYVPTPMIRYYNAIARYLGCRDVPEVPELFTTHEEESAVDERLAAEGVLPDQPVVVLNCGASFGPAKCWLPDRFAEVGDGLARRYDAAIMISCGPKETEIAHDVAARMKAKAGVLDQPLLGLGPLKALIRRSALLVTNDTGPRHFANAFGTPVVTIFGPTHPEWTLTPRATERSLRVDVDCGPCMKRVCPLDHRCMTRIGSDSVLAEAEKLIVEKRSSIAV